MHLEPAKGEESSGARARFKRKPSRIRAWRRTWLGQVHRAGRSGADWIIPEEEVMPGTFREHCCGCPYRCSDHLPPTKRRSPLSMEYNPDTTALLIFQSPGPDDWEKGRPICSDGQSSAATRIRNSVDRINRADEINITRCDFSITNAVQCYTGKGSTRNKIPDRVAQGQCANWLKMDIVAHPWRRIVVFGRIAEFSVGYFGYGRDPRFFFLTHPSGGLSNDDLDAALRWALEIKGASSRARRTRTPDPQ